MVVVVYPYVAAPALRLIPAHPGITAAAQVAAGPLDAIGDGLAGTGELSGTRTHDEVLVVGELVLIEPVTLVLVLHQAEPNAGLAQCTHVRPPILRPNPPADRKLHRVLF
jgi:hypothetical protein